jgi:hypothetical protein
MFISREERELPGKENKKKTYLANHIPAIKSPIVVIYS